MKIIQVDNFDRESISDILVAENVHKEYIKTIVRTLNTKYSGDYAENYYKAVEDDYKLFERDY